MATRLIGVDFAEFKLDEVWALQMASDIRNGRALPTTGIGSSLGFPNPPFFVYLLVVPLLVSPAPEIATAFIGILNVGAMLATAWLTRRLFGNLPSVTVAFLFAVAPWAVLYSRKIWAQEAMPVFLVLAIACLWHAIRQERPVWLVPSIALFALATQLHLTAVALAPLWTLVLLVPGRRARRLLFGAVGVAIAFLFYVPYLLWQANAGWPLLNRPSPTLGGVWSLDAPRLAREIVTGQPYLALANLGEYTWLASGWSQIQQRLLAIALILGIGRLIWAIVRDPARRWQAILVLGWLVLPVAAFLRPSVSVHPHYFITCLPAALITIAVGISPPLDHRLPTPVRAAFHWGNLAIVTLVVVGGTALFLAFFVALSSGKAAGEYGPPLASRREAIALTRQTQAATGEPIFVAGNYETTSVYRYLMASAGVAASFVDDQRLLVVPKQGGALYLITDDLAPVSGVLLGKFKAVTIATLRPTTGDRILRLVRIPDRAIQQVLDRAEVQRGEHRFANGMTLIASEVEPEVISDLGAKSTENAGKRRLPLTLYWQVEDNASGPGPQIFNHLVNPASELIAQADGPSFDPTEWSHDVVILTLFTIELPPTASGPALIRSGLYHLDTFERVPLVAGGEWVESRPIDLGPGRG